MPKAYCISIKQVITNGSLTNFSLAMETVLVTDDMETRVFDIYAPMTWSMNAGQRRSAIEVAVQEAALAYHGAVLDSTDIISVDINRV